MKAMEFVEEVTEEGDEVKVEEDDAWAEWGD